MHNFEKLVRDANFEYQFQNVTKSFSISAGGFVFEIQTLVLDFILHQIFRTRRCIDLRIRQFWMSCFETN